MATGKDPIFKQQLESLPGEFTMALEEYREAHYHYILNLLLHYYKLDEYIPTLPIEDQQGLFTLFESLHNYGFFGGVSFTLNPDVKFKDVANTDIISAMEAMENGEE